MTKIIQTPWGKAQNVRKIRNGFYFYETASHGGYYLDKKYNEVIPTEYRNEDGWYEEDCEALKVEYFLHQITQPFSKSHIREELEYYLGKKIGD